jgi:hypothetical protein
LKGFYGTLDYTGKAIGAATCIQPFMNPVDTGGPAHGGTAATADTVCFIQRNVKKGVFIQKTKQGPHRTEVSAEPSTGKKRKAKEDDGNDQGNKNREERYGGCFLSRNESGEDARAMMA